MPSEPSPGDVAVDAESLPSIKSRFAPVLADAAQAIVDEAMSAASKPERRVAPTEVKNILECIDRASYHSKATASASPMIPYVYAASVLCSNHRTRRKNLIDKNQQFQLVLLSALTLSFREGFKSSLKELAKTHGGGSGPWLDEIETTLLRELKSSVTEGVDITIEAEAMTGAINMLKMFFAEVRGELTDKDD